MSQKHYNIHYLEDTFKGLKALKDYSYQSFLSIKQGTILDLGCGIGMDVRNMASATEYPTTFIGIDHDASMIQKANTDKGTAANVQFINQEVSPLPFEANSIAGIRAERLFQHLPEPKKVLEDIAKVLQPGGVLVIVETDWDSISFYNAAVDIEAQVRYFLVHQKVVQGKIAKQLTRDLDNAQFRNISLRIFPTVLYTFKDACTYFWIDKIMDEMTAQGILSTTQCNDFLNSLKHADKEGYFACSINMSITSCTK